MVHMLKGGDEFAFPDVLGQVFDGMAHGEHGLVVEKMGYVRSRKVLFSVPTLAGFGGGGNGTGLLDLEVGLNAGAEEPL
jgi:hypothetical protein